MENGKRFFGICCVLSFLIGAMVGGGIGSPDSPEIGKKDEEQLARMAGDGERDGRGLLR